MIPNDPAQLALFILKYSGLAAFGLIFIQVFVGKFLKKKSFHIFLALVIFGLVLIHTFSYVFFIHRVKGIFDPFYPFTDLCLLCRNKLEHFINFGRIGLWLMAISVAAIFTKYKKYHWLGAFALIFLFLHYFFLK